MSPILAGILVALLLGQPVQPVSPFKNESAADCVTLGDGKILLGEVVESRSGTSLHVRREWARQHLPDWTTRWEGIESQSARRNQAKFKERLIQWQRERQASVTKADDLILSWIEVELLRFAPDDAWKGAPILLVKLGRSDVKTVQKVPRDQSRFLRLAWTCQIPEPESMKAADLKEALKGRGFDVSVATPVSIDALRSPQNETDLAWNLRRAATELSVDPGLRLIRYQGMLMPEPTKGEPPAAINPAIAIGALKQLLGDDPGDPLPAKLREIEASGRIAALVTRLDMAADFSTVTVEITLWMRQGQERWVPAGSRSSRVRPDDLAIDAGKVLAADPQVSGAFQILDALGIGDAAPELKRRSLKMGAATQKALGEAREAAEADLANLVLPVHALPAKSR